MKRILRISWLAIAALLPLAAQAFPPAPYHLIYGMVKDEYGTPLMSAQAKVVFVSSNGVAVATTVAPGLAIGVNFALEVPMDAGTAAGLYKATAQKSGALFKLYVVVGGVTNTPIQMTGGYKVLGKPAAQTNLDLTLGEDTNGNGIPDAWEYAFLGALGLDIDFATLRAGTDYALDGRTLLQEYQLGNYPFDVADSFSVKMADFNGGAAVLEFSTMSGRSYTVLGSPDLKQWTGLSFTIPSENTGGVHTYYAAPDIRTLQVQVVQPGGGATMRFFKLALH